MTSTVSLRFHLSSLFYRGLRQKDFEFWCNSKTLNINYLRFAYDVDLGISIEC